VPGTNALPVPVAHYCPHEGGLTKQSDALSSRGMEPAKLTAFARSLAEAEFVASIAELAQNWHDLQVVLRLQGAADASTPGFGNHVRRSFLGALAPGASPSARAGLACSWDPPCALDLFCREQFRGPRGDGMPKPYAIQIDTKGNDLLVGLTVFGMACDWFYVAAEAMSAGLTGILPWGKATQSLVSDSPEITHRITGGAAGLDPIPTAQSVRVTFLSPVDASSRKPVTPASLLSAALRRMDALSRWQGLALDPDIGREAAKRIGDCDFRDIELHPTVYKSPNRTDQARNSKVLTGSFVVSRHMETLWPLLQLCERTQIGRGTVQGLGRIQLEALE